MPTYEMICTGCNIEYEISIKFRDYDNMSKNTVCDECLEPLKRHFRTPANVTIPAHMAADGLLRCVGSLAGANKKLRIPLNFIDQKPDGSYRITRIGNTKADIDND